MVLTMSPISSILLLFLLLCAYDIMVHGDGHQGSSLLDLESLMPATVCSTSKDSEPRGNSLKVVQRHGPCFPPGDGQSEDPVQMLSLDSLRVSHLQNAIRLADASGNTSAHLRDGSVTIPAKRGFDFGTGLYVITIGIGTPKRDQTVIFDTGSSLCWIQCKPCRSGFEQREPIFDPSGSSSYRTVPYTAPPCINLPPARRSASGNNCVYRVHYVDSTSSTGLLVTEKLTLTNTTVFPSFVLGCAQTNSGLKGVAGMFGLGREFHSLVSQASVTNLGMMFSYCLPVSDRYAGHLTLGRKEFQSPTYTPMLPSRPSSPGAYFIDLLGITVGRQRLQIPPTVFRRAGTIVDSGTIISRLPAAAYTELRNAFRSGMAQYHHRLVGPARLLDTCYDFGNVRNPSFPPITLHFAGFSSDGTNLALKPLQVFFAATTSQICLAFAPTDMDGAVGIIGSVQQRGTEVIFDLGEQRIGFAAGNCGR